MKRYFNPENERIQYVVCETLNGHVPTMLNIVTGQKLAITPQTAAHYEIALPDYPLAQSCALSTAERYMERLAALNGLIEIE